VFFIVRHTFVNLLSFEVKRVQQMFSRRSLNSQLFSFHQNTFRKDVETECVLACHLLSRVLGL